MQNVVSPRPQVWGHRGAMDFAPQNTLPSFLLAQDQGADGVELDVQLTKDGVVVVFHDARVDALTDGRGPLAELPWTLVRKLDAGAHFGRSWRGTGIPTLADVLEAMDPRMTVNIELKTSLSEETWWDRVRTTFRGPQRLTQARVAAARVEAEPLVRAVADVVRGTAVDRLWLSSFDPVALELAEGLLPAVSRGFLHSPSTPWDTPVLMDSRTYQAWHPHHSQVTARAVEAQKATGRRIHVWTVNDPWHGVRLADLGVDALITNRPGEVRAVLG